MKIFATGRYMTDSKLPLHNKISNKIYIDLNMFRFITCELEYKLNN